MILFPNGDEQNRLSPVTAYGLWCFKKVLHTKACIFIFIKPRVADERSEVACANWLDILDLFTRIEPDGYFCSRHGRVVSPLLT